MTGWIVAVSIVGGLFLLTTIAVPLIWIFWFRHKYIIDRRASFSSKAELPENFYSEPGLSTPVNSENAEGSNTELNDTRVEISDTTLDETTTDAEKLNNKLLTYLEDESNSSEKSDKKYVSFKEVVERIEVYEDPEELKRRSGPTTEL
jgi:hypothetical protein